jgi:predicted RNA binding protein YcfA (HicA-like mRNA interferase family)
MSAVAHSVPTRCRRSTARSARLKDTGWELLRQRGSHEVWGKPGETARIVVAGNNSDTVPSGTLGSIRRASGLEHPR